MGACEQSPGSADCARGLVCSSLLGELLLTQRHMLHQPVPSLWRLPLQQKNRNREPLHPMNPIF